MPVIPIYHYSVNLLLDDSLKGWPMDNVMQKMYSKDFYKVAE